MKLNPVLLQKALSSLGTAVHYLSASIMPTAEDISEYNDYLRARKAIADAKPSAQPAKAQQPKKDRPDTIAEVANTAATTTEAEPPAADAEDDVPPRKNSKKRHDNRTDGDDGGGSLPDKPMKLARMTEFLKKWEQVTGSKRIESCSGYSIREGMNCSFNGAEYLVKALYDNGVALVNRRSTQYHRLVPVDQLSSLYPKPTGYSGDVESGQEVEVGFGLKESDSATSFRRAVVTSVKGGFATVRYHDNGSVSSVKVSGLRVPKR